MYVPVDPSLPRDVAETMLLDAGAVALVRGPGVGVEPDGVRTLDVDRLDLAGGPVHRPSPDLHPGNLAYCVFTSGSTGKPEPVAVAHASFVNHAFSLRDRLRLVATPTGCCSPRRSPSTPRWRRSSRPGPPGPRSSCPRQRRSARHALEFTGLISRWP